MSFDVRPDKSVFILYTGLTASGYDLASARAGDRVASLIEEIKSHRWPQEAVSYFSEARLEGQGVNPYWPRAAMLLDASFRLSGGPSPDYTDESAVVASIAQFPTDSSNKGADTVSWIKNYPKTHRLMEDDPFLHVLWERFLAIMDPDRLMPFEDAARDALAHITEGLGARAEDIPDFFVVPNPLQAPQVADFVRTSRTLFAVVAVPRTLSIAHELLHSVFENALSHERALITGYRHLFTPEMVTAMKKMQYAWNGGDESWLRVFEESLVRAASIWIGNKSDPKKADELAELESHEGFTYVPAILRAFRNEWKGPAETRRFIESCLRSLRRETKGMS